MAEAFLRKVAGDQFDVYSSGFEPHPVHPYVFKVMEELGYDLSDQYPQDLMQYLGKVYFGIVITVFKKAEEKYLTFPGISTRLYWPFEDPVEYRGTEEEKLGKFREV